MPREHLPPLGLLAVGGPLLDAGFVRLIDAELGPLSLDSVVQQVAAVPCDVVMVGHSGFSEEHDADFWQSYRHLLHYDPDQIQLLYPTHRWTPFYNTVAERRVIQTDTRRRNYKHQVLDNEHVAAWQVCAWFKLIEVAMQMRPKVIVRTL